MSAVKRKGTYVGGLLVDLAGSDAVKGLVDKVRTDTIYELPGHGRFWFYAPKVTHSDGSVSDAEYGLTYNGLTYVALGLAGFLAVSVFSRR
jgi:hypothetical protein